MEHDSIKNSLEACVLGARGGMSNITRGRGWRLWQHELGGMVLVGG